MSNWYTTEIESVKAQEEACVLPSFDSDVAWELGTIIRTHCQKRTSPAMIYIAHANSSQLLFFAASRPGGCPDHMHWVKRTEAVVLRCGASSYRMQLQLDQQTQRAQKAMYTSESLKHLYEVADPTMYAFHPGGFPVRVKNVEGIVGVIVVNGYQSVDGTSEREDHHVIVEGIKEYLARE